MLELPEEKEKPFINLEEMNIKDKNLVIPIIIKDDNKLKTNYDTLNINLG